MHVSQQHSFTIQDFQHFIILLCPKFKKSEIQVFSDFWIQFFFGGGFHKRSYNGIAEFWHSKISEILLFLLNNYITVMELQFGVIPLYQCKPFNTMSFHYIILADSSNVKVILELPYHNRIPLTEHCIIPLV